MDEKGSVEKTVCLVWGNEKIEVELRVKIRRGLVVRARKGYYGPQL